MSRQQCSRVSLWIGMLMLALVQRSGWAATTPIRCPGMTLRDMVGVARFQREGDPGVAESAVGRSPDRRYVVVVTQRGSFAANSAVAALRVWRVRAIRSWLRGKAQRPAPVLKLLVQANSQESFWATGTAVISEVAWSAHSRRLLFLGRRHSGRGFTLYSTSLEGARNEHLHRLSGRHQNVLSFTVRGARILYQVAAVTERDLRRSAAKQDARPYFDASGKSLLSVLFPTSVFGGTDQVQLWQSLRGLRSRIRVRSREWEIRESWPRLMMPSPAGGRLLMDLPVRVVPRRWMHYGHGVYPVWSRTGAVPFGDLDVWVPHQYVIVDRRTGAVRAALAAPDGDSRAFLVGVPGDPLRISGDAWAPDGKAILLWNTFLPRRGQPAAGSAPWGLSKPCLAIVDVAASRGTCAETLGHKGYTGTLIDARWRRGGGDRLLLIWKAQQKTVAEPYCVSTDSAQWIRPCGRAFSLRRQPALRRLRLRIVQSLNSPPELVAAMGTGRTRVLYDPNAKLRMRCTGPVQTVDLEIGHGRKVEAGLLLPVSYVAGHRYPLILQTHGYDPGRFLSTGLSAPFAARAFAASGMAVMQLPECPAEVIGTPQEIPCTLGIFRAAIRYADARGIVNPAKIGIIGFSRTAEHVLAALEHSRLHFAAAEIMDGVMTTYSQFVDDVGLVQGFDNAFEVEQMGGAPIGSGLRAWVRRASGFSIDKITAPLLVQANGRIGVLEMWEPYAILHHLGRPVDLAVLQQGSHPLSNPMQELTSERLGVDWFRFWLEDKRPASDSEYRRWSRLRASTRGVAAPGA
jgi:dipeptidyl aminopeptidase/acylaminoacyl peptidase